MGKVVIITYTQIVTIDPIVTTQGLRYLDSIVLVVRFALALGPSFGLRLRRGLRLVLRVDFWGPGTLQRGGTWSW